MKKENLLEKVQQLHKEGYSIREIAHKTGISKSSVGRITQKLQGCVAGTAIGTCPNDDPGTALSSVPEADWDTKTAFGSFGNSQEEAVPPLSPALQDDFALSEEVVLMLRKGDLSSRYSSFLDRTIAFLRNNLGSEGLALSLIKGRQEAVREFIQRARVLCHECRVDYEGLFMAHVLEQLHNFFGQHPELEHHPYSELKIKVNPALELLLTKALRVDVFAPR
ncbi:hypothetical protein GCM10027443_00700 [Pontibacter brevis]